jgi:hypothetical protein
VRRLPWKAKLRQQAADEAALLLPKMKERLNCQGVGGQKPNGSYISSGLLNVCRCIGSAPGKNGILADKSPKGPGCNIGCDRSRGRSRRTRDPYTQSCSLPLSGTWSCCRTGHTCQTCTLSDCQTALRWSSGYPPDHRQHLLGFGNLCRAARGQQKLYQPHLARGFGGCAGLRVRAG